MSSPWDPSPTWKEFLTVLPGKEVQTEGHGLAKARDLVDGDAGHPWAVPTLEDSHTGLPRFGVVDSEGLILAVVQEAKYCGFSSKRNIVENSV